LKPSLLCDFMSLQVCITVVTNRHKVGDGVEACFLTGYKMGGWRKNYINFRDQSLLLIKNDKQIKKEENYVPFLSFFTVFYLREFDHSPFVQPSKYVLMNLPINPLSHSPTVYPSTYALINSPINPLGHSPTVYPSTYALINSPTNPPDHSTTVYPSTYSLTNSPIHLPSST
jgi:hypothetical protein